MATGPFFYFESDSDSFSTTHYDFGVADPRGRSIGTNVSVCTGKRRQLVYTNTGEPVMETNRVGPDGYIIRDPRPYDYQDVPGAVYGFEPHATRGGVNYGACQRMQSYATIEARDAAVAKYLTSAKKRAVKAGGV